ncbi:hypothetical protein BLNAU_14408 [Blattamonas nauphoetae]|uniref:Uncharacterized protein n=1 Tax=Blattamonas nauphoetae TaxID=2049346 RepID=A0ABQ9XE43_9EUKA|nr:hypothetical protein BLNAU_14408 [Blattamonas nauphoetae]
MIPLSLLVCFLQSISAVTSRTPPPTNVKSLLNTLSNTPAPKWNEIRLASIPEGTYLGNNIKIMNRCLELSGERTNQKSLPGTRIILQSGSENSRNEDKFKTSSDETCIFSLTNSTLSLDSLRISLIANSEEGRQLQNEAGTPRLAIVSRSMMTISESRIEVSPWTSAIVISSSPFQESGTESSVVVQKCSISNDIGEIRGFVETLAFPDDHRSVSVSILGCSFDSFGILGKDEVGISLTRPAQKNVDEVGTISSSLIGCSFENMSSIGSSSQPQLSHLNQKMLGCVVSLTRSHLSGSTIRDVNNGGSILCSNSSFSSLLSSPNIDTEQPSVTLPEPGVYPEQFEDGTEYSFTASSGTEESTASFSHCRFISDETSGGTGGLCVRIDRDRTLTLQDCSFIECSSDQFGGALWVVRSPSCVLIDCLVQDCYSPASGAIHFKPLHEIPSSITLTRVAFTGI